MISPGPTDFPQEHGSSETSASPEEARLEALHRYDAVDTDQEEPFDRIARLAADLFDVPVALVSLVGDDRQWFKAAVGLEKQEVSLDGSFCSHAIQSEGAMIVEDAVADERFADSSLVTGNLGVRFYAGVPLETPDGYRIGTFCMLDTEPRTLSAEELDRLDDLAEMVMNELELRREAVAREEAEQALRESKQRYQTLVEHFPDGEVFLFNHDLEITLAGGAGLSETALSADGASGIPPRERFPPGVAYELERHLRATLEGERRTYEETHEDRHYRIRTVPVPDGEGAITGGMVVVQDVTEQKEQKRTLREVKTFNQELVERAPVGLYRLDEDLRIVYENPRAEEIVGVPADVDESRAIGTDIREVPSIVEAGVAEKFNRLLEGERISLDVEFHSIYGREAHIRGRGVPLFHDGDFDGAVMIVEDVSEHREAKQALREERDRLATLLDSLPVSVVHGVPNEDEFEVLTVNSTFEETFGVPASVIEGDDLHEHIVPPDRVDEAATMNRRVREESSLQAEVQRQSADGIRTFRTEASMRDPEEGPPEAYAIYTDVTERKEKEQEIERLRRKYQALLESAPDAIFVADAASGRIVEANEAAASLLETTEEDIVGRNQAQLHPEDEAERYESLFDEHRRSARSGSETMGQLDDGSPICVVTQSGTRVPVEINTATVDLEGRELMVGIFRDVAERRERERELEEAKEEAERMNRMKSTFLANMSHEIRTPLTSIIGFAESIGEEVEELRSRFEEVDWSALGQFAALIEQSGHNLLETLDAVLNLSKLEAGEMRLTPEPIDLAAAVKEASVQFEPQAVEAGVDLNVDVERPSVRARADEGGVQIVLRNLVSNAIKYTPAGGQVRIRVGEHRESVTLEVEDTGIGMNPKNVSGLFEAFKQESEGVDREYGGSGLGLAVTRKAVRQMEGSIEVETEKGEGSRFIVRLPRAEAVPQDDSG